MLKRVVLLLVLVVGCVNVGCTPPLGGIVFLPVTPGGSIEMDGTTFDVEPFYIAKDETTNAQYAAFVQAADGFDDPAWWNDMPAEYSPPQRGLSAPHISVPHNGSPNAPRGTVSWYQAVAFTRWLNARMGAKNADISSGGLLVNGVEWEVRLPAEWEWQWAAQGGAEAREYPWGDWQEGHANTSEAGVAMTSRYGTTAVGSYPLGAAASGALDMSGNVWEWCLNKRDSPYSTAVDATNELRALRGGSWLYPRELAASSFRIVGFPPHSAVWEYALGFRVGLFSAPFVGGANVGGAEDAAEAIVADPPVGDSDGIVFLPVTPRNIIYHIFGMYGSDVGVGYGAKLFLLNHLRRNESLDVELFNSTKGERRFRLLLSNPPDFERRQGKTYPLSVDLLADYNRRINSSFFGVGSMSAYDDEESYRREASEIRLTVGRGFSTTVVGQVALQYRSNRHSDFESDSRLQLLPPELNAARASYMSVRFDLRHDTRDSFVNPTRGLVIRGEAELAPRFGPNEFSYGRYAVWLHRYSVLRGPRTVLALRLGVEGLVGSELPVQTLLSLGGGSTLRGFSQDRYLDKGRGLLNAEVRFPIYGWLGGVAGVDTGRVWTSLSEASFRGWAVSHVVGLRAYLETYVVRLDMGFGDETTGVYFNAGHVH